MSHTDEKPPSAGHRGSLSSASNLYVLLFGCIMLAGILVLAWIGRPRPSIAVGEPLPPLDLYRLPFTGSEQPLAREDLRGKLALFHFWGTWCPPCMEEFPEFANLVAEFAGEDQIVFVSVSCSSGPEYDLEELARKTDAFLAKVEFRLPTYCDPAAMTRQQLALLLPNGSFGYPTTLLVGRDGKILDAMEGYLPGEMQDLASTIRKHLATSK